MAAIADIIDYIRDHPGCTTRDIAAHLDISYHNVSPKVTRLVHQGYIRREPESLLDQPRGVPFKLWVIE